MTRGIIIQFVKHVGYVMRSRKEPEERKQQILKVAMQMSKRMGYSHITRDGVAECAGVSNALVSYYFDTIDALKKEVLKEAIKLEVVQIIAQGIAQKDPNTAKLPPALKRKVVKYLSK